jgi:DnaJ-domain-containing protein 1
MGQIWDRMRRIADSYRNDRDVDFSNVDPKILEELRARTQHGSTAGTRSHRETEEERLKRLIDEASGQTQSSQQQQQQQQQPPRPKQGLSAEQALNMLGLPANASVDDMKRTYKKLMLKYHPDRVATLDAAAQAEAREKSQRINQAYQVLKNEKGF